METEYNDSDELEERLAIIEESRTLEEIEIDGFRAKLSAAKALLTEQGEHVGLCDFCLGSDKLIHNKSILVENELTDYEGIQYKVDNEIPTFEICFHGKDISEDFNF